MAFGIRRSMSRLEGGALLSRGPMVHCPNCRLRPVLDPDLAQDPLDVDLHGRLGDIELSGYALLELPSIRQRRIDFSRGESCGAIVSSVVTKIDRSFSSGSAALLPWSLLVSRANDRNAGGKTVSPIATSSIDLMNASQELTFTK